MYIKNYSNNNFQTFTKINTIFDFDNIEFEKNYNAWWSFFFDIRTSNWSEIVNNYKITNRIEIYDECLERDIFVWYIRGYNFTEQWVVRIYWNDDLWVYDNIKFEWSFTGQAFNYTIDSIINQFFVSTWSNGIRSNIIVESPHWSLFASWWDISNLSWIWLFDQIKSKFPTLYWVFKDWKIYITDKDKYDVILQWSYRYDQNDLANNTIEWFEVKNNRDSYELPFTAQWLYEDLYIDIDVEQSKLQDIDVWNKKRVYLRWCDGVVLADYIGIVQSIEYKSSNISFYNITVSNWKTYTWPYLKKSNRFLREKLY